METLSSYELIEIYLNLSLEEFYKICNTPNKIAICVNPDFYKQRLLRLELPPTAYPDSPPMIEGWPQWIRFLDAYLKVLIDLRAVLKEPELLRYGSKILSPRIVDLLGLENTGLRAIQLARHIPPERRIDVLKYLVSLYPPAETMKVLLRAACEVDPTLFPETFYQHFQVNVKLYRWGREGVDVNPLSHPLESRIDYFRGMIQGGHSDKLKKYFLVEWYQAIRTEPKDIRETMDELLRVAVQEEDEVLITEHVRLYGSLNVVNLSLDCDRPRILRRYLKRNEPALLNMYMKIHPPSRWCADVIEEKGYRFVDTVRSVNELSRAFLFYGACKFADFKTFQQELPHIPINYEIEFVALAPLYFLQVFLDTYPLDADELLSHLTKDYYKYSMLRELYPETEIPNSQMKFEQWNGPPNAQIQTALDELLFVQ